MPGIPTAGLNAAIAAVVVPATTYYISAHSADPGTTGASELSGGGYARQAATFTAASGGVETNVAGVAIPNAGTVPVPFLGVWSAVTAGTFVGRITLTGTVTAASISALAGALSFTAS